MICKSFSAMACLLLLGLAQAQAHFVWLGPLPGQPAGGEPQFALFFGEQAEPSEPHLIGKIAQAKAWLRSADGNTTELAARPAAGDVAALALNCPSLKAGSLESTCDYGVYERGPGVLLQYYAKHLAGDWTQHADKLARAERLALDIVPEVKGNQLVLQLLYKDKPSAKSELVVVDPAGDSHELKTDDDGRVSLPATAGNYALRGAHIEADKAGERSGKKYAQTWHYCTLTLNVPAQTAAASSELTAVEALRRARDGRAIWENFPGFQADVTVTSAGKQETGKVTIDDSGNVTLDMPKSGVTDWVEEQLASLVQHRKPDGEVAERKVVYADEDRHHPLGRKIELGDAGFQSAYRLKDDVIMEVNRSAGPQKFTISVLEIIRNAEGKYLPRSFTMNFFDAKSGELKTSLAYWNEWQRVGSFDLPKSILEVSAQPGGAVTKQIDFSNFQITKK